MIIKKINCEKSESFWFKILQTGYSQVYKNLHFARDLPLIFFLKGKSNKVQQFFWKGRKHLSIVWFVLCEAVICRKKIN